MEKCVYGEVGQERGAICMHAKPLELDKGLADLVV